MGDSIENLPPGTTPSHLRPQREVGKAHAAEIPFVFKSLAPDWWPPGAEAVSDAMQGHWSRFATSGDPNGADAVDWPVFATALGNRLQLNTDPMVVEGFRAERCAVWREVFATQQ